MSAADRVALITGAAGGIGRALVDVFSAAGFRVFGTDRIAAPPGLAVDLYLQVDLEHFVADPAFAGQVLARVNEHLGDAALAALVNNAAIQVLGGAGSLDRSAWKTTLDVNVVAPFLWVQGLLPALERGGGCIVNVSSIHARLTKPEFVAYATSKAALSGMTRALAVDLRGRVRVNAIEPAAIATDMLRAGFEGRPEAYARLEACHPQGRIGSPAEVAVLALAIVDGPARFMHGACVALDGGIGNALHDPA